MPSSRPLCGYRRLSVDRTGKKIGYEVQTDDVNAWAAHQGRVIERWYEDKNESAADENVTRKGYEEMLRDLEAGMYGGIVVWRIDRLTRIDEEFLRVLKIARKVGAYVYSISEGSTETDENILSLKVKVLFGDAEVKGVKRRISANKQLRKKKGLYSGGGHRPYGFEGPIHDAFGRVTNTGRVGVVHVEEEVQYLREAARQIAWENGSYSSVIRDWHSRPVPVLSATGKFWSIKTLQTLLTSPRMIGKQAISEEGATTLVDAIWEPVLDKATWRRLVLMAERADRPHNARGDYPLSGEIRCGNCKLPLTGCQRTYLKGGQQVSTRGYRCSSGAAYKARGHCGKLNVIAEPVERIIVATALGRLKATRGFAASVGSAADETMARIDAMEQEIAGLRDEALALEAAYKEKKLKLDKLLRLQEPIEAEIERLEQSVKALAAQLDVPVPAGKEWADLIGWYENGLTPSQKRDFIWHHIRYAEVKAPGRSGRYFRADRVHVEPFDIPLGDSEVPDTQGD